MSEGAKNEVPPLNRREGKERAVGPKDTRENPASHAEESQVETVLEAGLIIVSGDGRS